jgi:hypothetical protein
MRGSGMVGRKGSLMVSRSQAQPITQLARGVDTSITIVPKVYHVHLRAWENLKPPALRRYRQRGTMGKARGY